jgi:hypothetical protein
MSGYRKKPDRQVSPGAFLGGIVDASRLVMQNSQQNNHTRDYCRADKEWLQTEHGPSKTFV